MLFQTKGKLDDDEDEGLARNSSIEDAESIQSSETEKQGGLHDKPTNREVNITQSLKSEVTEELESSVASNLISAHVDQNIELSLKEGAEVLGKCSPKEERPVVDLQNRPTEEDGLSEEERRKKSYEAEVKSWLLERMQAPIQGRNSFESTQLK